MCSSARKKMGGGRAWGVRTPWNFKWGVQLIARNLNPYSHQNIWFYFWKAPFSRAYEWLGNRSGHAKRVFVSSAGLNWSSSPYSIPDQNGFSTFHLGCTYLHSFQSQPPDTVDWPDPGVLLSLASACMLARKKDARKFELLREGFYFYFFRENEENYQKQARLKASSLLNMGS